MRRALAALLLALAFIPQLAQAVSILSTEPAPGSTVPELREVEILFDGPVSGVDAADLLLNGLPAVSVTEPAPGLFVFAFPQPPAGDCELRWIPNPGITSAAHPSQTFPGGAWNLRVDPALARRQVVISEFMADADAALYDDDCDRSDWIEIHNAGTTPVDLEGWSLTDDATLPRQWVFPPYTLEPNAYLVVFASEKNKLFIPTRACRTRTNTLAGFHTNFRLSAEGEYLALIAPDGEVISSFAPAYPPQRRDISYGRMPGAGDRTGYLARPTPRAPNAVGGAGFAPAVEFSRPSGTFLQPFHLQLHLATASSNAVIRYTVDGTFPAETNRNLRTYTAPLPITNSVQIRARADAPGLLPGAPASETYLQLTDQPAHLASFTSNIPIVVMSLLRPGSIGASANTPVHFSVYEPRRGRASLLDPPAFATRGAAKTRGSSTGAQPQSNFAIEWWDEFNQDTDHPVLGMPEDSEWVLYAPNEFDAALIHNPFTMELSRQMNFAAPRTRFVEVYLHRTGAVRSNDWFGLYVLMEKPGLSRHRINAPKADPEDTTPPEVTGSYLFKTDRLDPSDSGFSAGGAVNAYVEPKEREMRAPQRAPQLAYLSQFFRNLDTALNASNPNFRHPTLGYRGYLDLTNWMDFHLLETLSGQVDAIRLSTYFYKRREGKLEYGPRWDYDRAWESKGDNRDDNPRAWDSGGGLFGPPWWNRLLADSDAWQVWIDRYQLWRQTALSSSNMFSVLDGMTNEIRVAQPRENRRWTATAPRVNYPNEIRIMKTWISNRLAWLDTNFAQPPTLTATLTPDRSRYEVTLTPPASRSSLANVALYYTLDGSDPRPSRGTSAPVALRYSAPFTVATNARVVARTRDLGRVQRGPRTTSTWSGPASASLILQPTPLTLSEVMAHPAPPPPGSPFETADFEFLELHNPSERTLDLAHARFTEGISFHVHPTNTLARLAPGAYVVLVRHPGAFLSRHPGAAPRVAGVFDGNLADEGERLVLESALGEVLLDVRFQPGAFPASNGLGFSLVPLDDSVATPQPPAAPTWRPSATDAASPGFPDPSPASNLPRVRVHEVHATSGSAGDWIELHNPESRPADIGGWFLTDDLDAPRAVRLPPGLVLAPGEYRVLSRDVFNPSGTGGFGLDPAGDATWLLSADPAGHLTGWIHGYTFGALPPNASSGVPESPIGSPRGMPLARATPGAPNVPPTPGLLAITEVAPPAPPSPSSPIPVDPFVEIANVSDLPVTLFDPRFPESAWKVRGTLDFTFPTRTPAPVTLAPGQRLLLVEFDPDLHPGALAAFRNRQRVPPDIALHGPWTGAPTSEGLTLRPLGHADPAGAASPTPPTLIEEWTAPPPAKASTDTAAPLLSHSRRWPLVHAWHPDAWTQSPPTPGQSDRDTDGLPDAWEQRAGLDPASASGTDGGDGDPDGDGFVNRLECLNGTDPQNPASRLALRTHLVDRHQLGCVLDALPGTRILLERLDLTAPEAWVQTADLRAPEPGRLEFILPTHLRAAQLFRVRLP